MVVSWLFQYFMVISHPHDDWIMMNWAQDYTDKVNKFDEVQRHGAMVD